MEHDSDAGFHHTNPSETKKPKQNSVLTAHTPSSGVLKRKLVLQKSTKKSSGQSAVRKSPVPTGWKCKDLHDSLLSQIVKSVTSAGHLPKTSDPMPKVASVAKSCC